MSVCAFFDSLYDRDLDRNGVSVQVITGTPAFFEGPQGIQRLPPLAQRLDVDFSGDPRFDNPRAPQVRLRNFDIGRLQRVGRRVREVYADGAAAAARIRQRADDAYLDGLANAVTGELRGRVGIAPRVFLKKLVQDVLDRIDLHPRTSTRAATTRSCWRTAS